MEIRILPGNVANMIAAGEVVQRPASVVKELMENAVDAGADKVDVVIRDAGRTLIQVIDNGCGMSPDEAVLCFERHATSKLASAEDLQRIVTFGFRGEALASIAAVAEVTLKTRRKTDETGCKVEFADSKHVSTEAVSCPAGSNFAVRNLFYNVPARRKFLKSDNIEFKHIVEEFTRVALTRPGIAFSLMHNDKTVFTLRSAKSVKYRIQDLLGTNAVDAVVDIKAETSAVDVAGYICRPDLARKTAGNQFFFVNGRYFRSAYFHKAVMKAYEGLLADGAVPSYFIFLSTDPGNVDVNIHPSKTEIKFEDDSVIFQVIYACVRESLGRNSFGSSIDFDTEGAPEMPVIGKTFEHFHPEIVPPSMGGDPYYNPFEQETAGDGSSAGDGTGGAPYPSSTYQPSMYQRRKEDYSKLFDEGAADTSPMFIMDGRYIVVKREKGMAIVNVFRARERILYERFLRSITSNGHVSQTSLFPVQVAVGADNRLVFDEHRQLLESLGFDISPFGTDTIVVNGVPEGFSCDPAKVEALMADVLLILNEEKSMLPEVMESALAGKFARVGASAGRTLVSVREAQSLLDNLNKCDNPVSSPEGKKISVNLSLDEIEKKF